MCVYTLIKLFTLLLLFFKKKMCVLLFKIDPRSKMRSLIYLVVNLAVSSALSGRRVSKARANCYLFLLTKPFILALLIYLIFFCCPIFLFFHFYTVIHTIYFRSNPETLQCSQILHKQFKQAESIWDRISCFLWNSSLNCTVFIGGQFKYWSQEKLIRSPTWYQSTVCLSDW